MAKAERPCSNYELRLATVQHLDEGRALVSIINVTNSPRSTIYVVASLRKIRSTFLWAKADKRRY